MSTSTSKTDQDSNKSSISGKNKSKKSEPKFSEPETEASTSTSRPNTDETKKLEENESWTGFFSPNMWYWKPVEPQQEVLLKNWSLASVHSVNNENEPNPQTPARETESQYIWPNTIHIKEPQRLANQPTLDQLVEQRKLHNNQMNFSEDFNKHVDYLGERISRTKLNILIAQLNNLLPTTSEELTDATRTLTRSKPLQVKKSSSKQLRRKTSKAAEPLSPEETAQREQLRQNQLQEYESLREQIGLFEESTSTSTHIKSGVTLNEITMEETISKTDLKKFVDALNKMPDMSKNNMKTLQNLIEEKPQILKILREAHKNKKSLESLTPEAIANQTKLRQKEMQEFDNMRDQIALYEESSMLNIITTKIVPENTDRTFIEETISKTKLQKLVIQLNKPTPQEEQEPPKLVPNKTSKTTPEEKTNRAQLRQLQIQEYENLREQIGLFGERKSDITLNDRKGTYLEEKISKSELDSFINQLNAAPHPAKKIKKEFPTTKSK